MMLRFYQKRRDASRLKWKGKNSEDIGKSTEPGDIKIGKNSKSRRQVKSPVYKNQKKGVKKSNESFVELEKLTKNIEKMYNGLSHKKVLESFSTDYYEAELIAATEEEFKNLMERELEEKVSFIKAKSIVKKKKKKTGSVISSDDLYGLKKSNLSIDKAKQAVKYSSKRVATETITDKIHPLTPSQPFYGAGEYFCT